MLTVDTVPVWDDHGEVHVAGPNEVREDLADHVIGWSNLATIELEGEEHVLLLVA